jgi:hypothetical protein
VRVAVGRHRGEVVALLVGERALGRRAVGVQDVGLGELAIADRGVDRPGRLAEEVGCSLPPERRTTITRRRTAPAGALVRVGELAVDLVDQDPLHGHCGHRADDDEREGEQGEDAGQQPPSQRPAREPGAQATPEPMGARQALAPAYGVLRLV